jgi:bacillithiol biosynthesis cysteine-adding enzyme BshC
VSEARNSGSEDFPPLRAFPVPFDRIPAFAGKSAFLALTSAAGPPETVFLAPGRIASFEGRAEALRGRRGLPGKTGERLYDLNRSLGAGPETLRNLDRLARGEAFAVVTGQQPGLLGGPGYVLWKAATAAALARALEARGLGGFVPVFWSASEDHDAREFTAVRVPAPDGALRKITLRLPPGGKGQAASALLEEGMLAPALADFLSLARRDGLDASRAEDLRSLPAGGPAPFFGALLLRFLADWGLVLAEPRLLREAGARVFARELADPDASSRALQEGGKRLEALGWEAPLSSLKPPNLFLEDEEGFRRRIRWEDGRLELEGTGRVDAAELLARAAQLSTNVALRPLLQDSVLPVIAYAAGPGEAAYLAQLGPLYDLFGLGRPLVFPRLSATLLNPREAEAVERDGTAPEELFTGRRAPGGSPAAGRLARARRAGLPRGELQERAVSWLWQILRHGPELPGAILEACDPFDFRHQVLVSTAT